MHIVIAAVSSARQPSGICRHAATLASSLVEMPEVSRVTLLVGEWQQEYFENAFGLTGSRLHVVPVAIENNSFARNRWYHRTLSHAARDLKADVVHLSFPAPIPRKTFFCPVVGALHDLYPYDAPLNFGYVRVLFNRLFLRQCLRASDTVVCSSDFTLDRLRHCAPRVASEKAIRIYQSVALDPSDEKAPSNPHLTAQPFLLTVAQHRRNKNVGLLLSAFDLLRQRNPASRRLRLLIIGAEGPETRTLRSLVQRLSLEQLVHFESALSDGELCCLYRRCELLIAPSSVEGFCFPVVEALRCGSRVLCSDIPVLHEVGGGHCRYFSLNVDNPMLALANAIEAALLEPVPEAHAPDRFSLREMASHYVALYSTLLAGGRQPHALPGLFSNVDSLRL
jgi:glycosyltransferase involved in cell wall biosynthesis